MDKIVLLLCVLLLAGGYFVYDLNQRYLACKRANTGLAALVLEAGEKPSVELRADERTGDVAVRVAGQHYYFFADVCGRDT